MEIKYPEEMGEMLLLRGAYLKTRKKRPKSKDEIYIEEMYCLFVPEEIRDFVSEHEDLFDNAKGVRNYLRRKWGNIHKEIIRSSLQG